MSRTSSFQCTACEHEWAGKPTWDRSSPPRCAECGASGEKIEAVHEPPDVDDPDRELEADLVTRLRNGESPLDIVEAGVASLEEAKRVLEELSDLDEIVVLEEDELNEREATAVERGKRSRDDEVESLKAKLRQLRRQLAQSNSAYQESIQQTDFLLGKTQWQSQQLAELREKNQQINELESELEWERHERKRAEQEVEQISGTVEEELEDLRQAHEERQKELGQNNQKLREKNRRINELEELLVDDIAQVAATVRAMRRPGVGLGTQSILQGT